MYGVTSNKPRGLSRVSILNKKTRVVLVCTRIEFFVTTNNLEKKNGLVI